VLKYVGDAIIALFPAEYDSSQGPRTQSTALRHAGDHQKVHQRRAEHLRASRESIRVSIDYGDVQVVLYGKRIDRSHIDIVGSNISMAAKMIPLAQIWQIVIGQSTYEKLDSKQNFVEMNVDARRSTYIDEKSGSSYKLYAGI
jgi:class 3 adenylate cyclase